MNCEMLQHALPYGALNFHAEFNLAMIACIKKLTLDTQQKQLLRKKMPPHALLLQQAHPSDSATPLRGAPGPHTNNMICCCRQVPRL